MTPARLSLLLLLCSLALPTPAQARPFRAMVTRTAATTGPQHLEFGLRLQGYFLGDGPSWPLYGSLTPGVRFGIVDKLELNIHLDLMLHGLRGSSLLFSPYLGDLPIGLQWSFLTTKHFAMGLWGRVTLPAGAASFERLPTSLQDRIPPSLPDGTWDVEGTLILEVRFTDSFRLMANVGYLFHGVRQRPGAGAFDVPDAIGYNLAGTLNVGQRVLLGLELVGRSYFQSAITPVWTNNNHHLELLPSARFEIVPNLVLEVGLGLGLTRDLGEIYRLRALLGLTYEFDLLGRNKRRR